MATWGAIGNGIGFGASSSSTDGFGGVDLSDAYQKYKKEQERLDALEEEEKKRAAAASRATAEAMNRRSDAEGEAAFRRHMALVGGGEEF